MEYINKVITAALLLLWTLTSTFFALGFVLMFFTDETDEEAFFYKQLVIYALPEGFNNTVFYKTMSFIYKSDSREMAFPEFFFNGTILLSIIVAGSFITICFVRFILKNDPDDYIEKAFIAITVSYAAMTPLEPEEIFYTIILVFVLRYIYGFSKT